MQPLKIFIGGVDSYIGSNLVETLRNDDDSENIAHQIYGTKCHLNTNTPNGVKTVIDVFKIIKNSNKRLLCQFLINSDVIIYDLRYNSLDEIYLALNGNVLFLIFSSKSH